jgi:outer membrane lipoprotein-sorting protein
MNQFTATRRAFLAGASALAASSFARLGSAQDAAARGLAVARSADSYANGFVSLAADMRMILRDKQGQESVREMRTRSLEVPGDGDKSIVLFDLPRDISGTALLTFTHRAGADDQWLYLPALKRVKRIASDNKSGPFMGSEFAYEDIASPEVEKYSHLWLREETVQGQVCNVLEQRPVDTKSGYQRRLIWLDKAEHRAMKVEFFDRQNQHVKTLVPADYRKYLAHQWRPASLSMTNHISGKSTRLEFKNYVFNAGLSERDFDTKSLERLG